MKVALIHNEDAGDGVSSSTLNELIARAGHDLVPAPEAELLVAAGGDGTVADAVRRFKGNGVPLTILALGTANNIAESLGLTASVDEAIDRWRTARRVPFDVGTISDPNGARLFVEGVGVGLIPAAMRSTMTRPIEGADTNEKIANALARYRDVLDHLEPVRWKLAIDGTTVDDDFLAIEVLNIRSIGPNLILTPAADPGDGLLSVVIADAAHRQALATYLETRTQESGIVLTLPTRQARHIDLTGEGEMHVDDEVLAIEGTVSIAVEPAAIELLV